MVLEPARDAAIPTEAVAHPRMGIRVDYYGRGPMLELSPEQTALLVRGDARPPTEIPDPNWVPPVPRQEDTVRPDWRPAQPPMVKQRLEDRAAGTHGQFLVLQPVSQILVRRLDAASWTLVRCAADPATGNHMAFLVDPASGEGFFYGGRFQF